MKDLYYKYASLGIMEEYRAGAGVNISAATLKSMRESRSFRHTTIPIAGSSPASARYITKNQIAPSTYCFTEALRAIQQTRCGSGRESMVPIRFFERKILNSKWDEAEKYICNPLSGEVPIQCLSSGVIADTWTERAHRPHSFARSVSKSAPLPTPSSYERLEPHPVLTISEIKEITFSGNAEVGQLRRRNGSWMRDVGTQITPLDCSSSSPSITSAPLKDEMSESFRLMGRGCFIFQRKPRPELLEKKPTAAPRKKKQGRSKENEKTKKVTRLLGWKMWEACKQEKEKKKKNREKKGEKRAGSQPLKSEKRSYNNYSTSNAGRLKRGICCPEEAHCALDLDSTLSLSSCSFAASKKIGWPWLCHVKLFTVQTGINPKRQDCMHAWSMSKK